MSVEKPKIAVIIPCYNHGKFLKESVESIITQSYKNLEIFIVDDGSTDNTQQIMTELATLDDRINLIYVKENMGKWHALNLACELASATIITSHDADDLSLPNRIERQYQAMIETGTIHNLCGFHHCWSQKEVTDKYEKEVTGELTIIRQEVVKHFVLQGYGHPHINHYYTGQFETAGVSSMFYRDAWKLGMRFNPPEKGLRTLNSEDSDFNFRLTTLLGSTSVLAEKLYCYRRNTSTNNEKK